MAKAITGIADLTPDSHNANRGTPRGRGVIEDSLRKRGAGRSILADAEGRIIAGNKTLDAAADIGLPVRVIQTDGRELVVVQRTDLDLSDPTGPARMLAYDDNRAAELGLDWDEAVLAADIEAGLNLEGLWRPEDLDELLAGLDDGAEIEDYTAQPDRSELVEVPDIVFPSDNAYGIPTLDLAMQAEEVTAPVLTWGSVARTSVNGGTWGFYTDDARFEALWKDPAAVLGTECVAAIEPNFSVSPQAPLALVLWNTFRKRWIARYWQSRGVRVFVDLNVCPLFADANVIGVPAGWGAFATRGVSDRPEETVSEWERACAIRGGDDVLFMVCGGGREVGELCRARGWVWVPEHMDRAKGKYQGDESGQ